MEFNSVVELQKKSKEVFLSIDGMDFDTLSDVDQEFMLLYCLYTFTTFLDNLSLDDYYNLLDLVNEIEPNDVVYLEDLDSDGFPLQLERDVISIIYNYAQDNLGYDEDDLTLSGKN